MEITDATPVIYETGKNWAYDFAPDMEADIHCLGLAAGDVEILHWDDLE